MHVAVENGLAGSFIDIDADVIAIGMETFVNLLFDILKGHIHGFTLMISEVEIRCNMTFWDDQCMPG